MAPAREKNEEPGKWLDLAENRALSAYVIDQNLLLTMWDKSCPDGLETSFFLNTGGWSCEPERTAETQVNGAEVEDAKDPQKT